MSTILAADETGTLHLPPSLLPHPGPGRRYRVASEAGQVTVGEAVPDLAVPNMEKRLAWLRKLDQLRAHGATGKVGTPLQTVLDELRAERI